MKKRIVSFLLALVMAVSLLPVSAFAADGAYTVAEDAKSPISTFAEDEDNSQNMPSVQSGTEYPFSAKYEKTSTDILSIQETTYRSGQNSPVYLVKCAEGTSELYLFFEATSKQAFTFDISFNDYYIDALGSWDDPSDLYDESDHSWKIELSNFSGLPSTLKDAEFYNSANTYYWAIVSDEDGYKVAFEVCFEVAPAGTGGDYAISNAGTGTNLGNCTYEGESYPVYKISLDETYDTVTFTIADDAEYNNIYLSEADEVGLFGNSSEATVACNDETYEAAKTYYTAVATSFNQSITNQLSDSATHLLFKLWKDGRRGGMKGYLIIDWEAAGTGGDGKMDAEAILATEPIGTCTVDLGDGNETLPLRFKKVGADVSALTAADNEWSFYDTDSTAELSHYFAEAARNDTFFKACVKAYNDNKAGIETDTVLSNNADHLLMYAYNSNTEDYYMLLLEWEKGVELTDEQKKPLADLLATVADGNTNYYQSDDRWNGKTASKTGFWAEFTAANGPRAKAQKVLETAATEEQITTAVTNLQTAIASLIPASQANTTALYEALQAANELDQNDYSAKSWAAYKTVRDKAEALMDSMFLDDGSPNPTNNTKDKNTDIQTMADQLEAARKALDAKAGSTAGAKLQLEAIRYLAEKYDPDKLSGYTAESMAALREARTAALTLASETTLDSLGQKEAQALTAALLALRKAIYGLVIKSEGQIQVKVSVLDANDVYRGRGTEAEHNQNTYTGTLTLSGNASAYHTLESMGLLKGRRDTTAEALVYLNGELLYDSGMSMYSDMAYVSGEYVFNSTKLHDGDELTVVWIYPKQIMNSSTVGTYSMPLYDNPNWFRYSTVSAPLEVAAGEPFSVSVTSDNALPFHGTEGGRTVSGAKVYRSEAAAIAQDAATGYVGVDTFAVTDATGKATVTLYDEGYVLLNAFRMDDEGRYTVGASVLVHVNPASSLSAVKKQLRAELDAVYYDEQHPESVFTADNWQKVQDAYNTAVKAIDAAETTGAASAAQQTAIKTIKDLQKNADSFNASNLASFRKNLNELPDDLTKLDQTATKQIEALKKYYDAMSPYQRSQLTGKEQKKYDAVIKAYDKGLDEPHSYQLTFRQQFDNVPAEDQAALKSMIAYLQAHTPTDDKYGDITSNKKLPQLFGFQVKGQQVETAQALTYNISACVNPDYVAYLLCRDAAIKAGNRQGPGVISGKGWSISDATAGVSFIEIDNNASMTGGMTYTINGKEYAIRSIGVSGTNVPLSGTDSRTWQYKNGALIDATNYKGKTENHINYSIPNALIDFHMPYGDVTITVTWAPVNAGNTALDMAKATAIAHLKTVRDGLTGDGVQAAHDAGVAAINAAKNTADVDKAYQAAVKNMRATASSYGTVYVTVENSTFPKEDWGDKEYWEGVAVYEEEITLTASSTMMSCVKEALENWGYSQEGAENNYISSITVYGRTLAQINGGPNSGWMGALNDWFTNKGFGEFNVANGTLTDGDVIHIMYTRDLGVDLDGTWGNSDTTLKALEVKNGELLGEFASGKSGGSYEYVLAINGDEANIQLMPTAANKNFLTKIFLNEKVTDNTEGVSFYKRTQSIPVKAGDVIYVGCGERAWPTMNNQSGNRQENEGTWYALRVVNANGGADVVKDMINALPATVSYENYPTHAGAVAAARAAYEVLSESEKAKVDTKKLEALEKAIAEFQAIDELKDMLDKLPDSGKLTIKDRSAVEAAQKIYDQLTDAQKDNLTFAQIEKMQELSERMAELIKQNPDPTPTDPDDDNNDDNKPNRDHHRRGTTANSTSDTKTDGKDVKSGNTGDAGITLYLGMGLVAILAGAAVVARKRKENE